MKNFNAWCKKIGVIFVFPLLLTLISFYFLMKKQETNQIIAESPKTNHLTIFIHGTILPLRFPQNIKEIVNDIKKPSLKKAYQNYLDNLRINSSFRKQPIGPRGLFKVDLSSNQEKLISFSSKIIISAYKETELQINPNVENSFYLFGWNGNLKHKDRVQAAFKLYKDLQDEIENIKKTSDLPIKITLLAHSHGGNVALNLELAEIEFKKNLEIDELILLGTPIQKETKNFASSPIFKKIYNIYSRGDAMQTIDILSTRGFKSKRRFELPDPKYKIKEIEIKVENKKPVHCELWFTGNFPLFRKNLPLYPFPIVVFAPMIVKLTNETSSSAPNSQNFLIKIIKKTSEITLLISNKEKTFFKKNVLGESKLENIDYLEDLFCKFQKKQSKTTYTP